MDLRGIPRGENLLLKPPLQWVQRGRLLKNGWLDAIRF